MKRTSTPILITVLSMTLLSGYAKGQSKIHVHGHLTQAYAFTDGRQVLGIPDKGTTDYRTLALQFGYALNDNSKLVIQFSHRRMGLSPVATLEDEVKLDWAFAEYRFTETISGKIGKVQLPVGIYNEVRDVGTILPFYRIPFYTYGEGIWSSETVDGIVLSAYILQDSPWNLDISVFYGGWDLVEANDPTTPVMARVEDGAGGQLWLNTPVDGLRVGLAGHRATLSGGNRVAGKRDHLTTWTASLDASFERFTFQAEYIDLRFDIGSWKPSYAHLGYNITEKLRANAQIDLGRIKFEINEPFFSASADANNKDYAIGFNYRLSSNLVLKAEHHWMKGYLIDDNPPNVFTDDPVKVQYTIISASASF